MCRTNSRCVFYLILNSLQRTDGKDNFEKFINLSNAKFNVKICKSSDIPLYVF